MKLNFKGTILVMVLFLSLFVTPKLSAQLKGIVIDNESHEPIPGAAVRILENNSYGISDGDGKFEIVYSSDSTFTIEVTHLTFMSKKIIVEKKSEFLVVHLNPKTINLNQIVVTEEHEHKHTDRISEYNTIIKGNELQKELGLTLASTLKNEVGLAMRSMGPAPARPVLRGLSGDRVLISEDGLKSIDLSATSPDHAVVVEPFSVERIEVLRGPKVLLKTSTTIGGIVNVVKHEIPVEQQARAYMVGGTYVESVNKGLLGTLQTGIPISDFMLRGEVSKRSATDLKTPIGKLAKSYSNNFNYNGGISFIKEWGMIGVGYKNFELNYGVPGGFIGAHPNGVDIEIEKEKFSFKSIIYPSIELIENIKIDFSNNAFRQKEFESNGLIGSDFKVDDNLGSLQLNHNHDGIFGISFEHRDYNIGGFVFTPPTKSLNLSAYLYQEHYTGKFNFEFAARYNYDNVDPQKKNPNAKIGNIDQKVFNTYSLSFTTLYELTDIVHLGINVSRSSRVPTIEELFSEGPHLAAYSYEIGNPDLQPEHGLGSELFIYHDFNNLYYNINVFYNRLNSYIIPRNTGEINYSTFLPIYKTEGVKAELYGIENQLEWKASKLFQFNYAFSYTIGNNVSVDKPLPQIPPAKLRIETIVNLYDFKLSISSDLVSKQSKVDENEEATSGYVVFNSSLQYQFQTGGHVHNLSLNLDNIFNKEYRNHLSRVKSIMPEAGFNIRAAYKIFFEI